ncbi:MAG: chemotaxis response regulator protein-glutamate methylesterase [Arcobacter sp.]|nr:MAG: chemotaxis response regulator protein-glutamate methylesterase [Arcobacter sp.]
MVKVFIIDDSMLIRNILTKILKNNNTIVVIGEANNPLDAFEEFKKVGLPDVFILDIEMPKMDGISFLKKLNKENPVPTIIFSSMVNESSTKVIEALENGASDVIIKPLVLNDISMDDFKEDFISTIKAAAYTKSMSYTHFENTKKYKEGRKSNKIIAIGASTGGVQTLEAILKNLHPQHPPILITQHMPAGFTKSFAKRLHTLCLNSDVKEAKNGDILLKGNIYISPGDMHLEVKYLENEQYTCILKNYPKVSGHKPSVDVLFKSFSKEVKKNAVAFLLTGMGKDGAKGLQLMKETNAMTYGQDEASCIVYGMPKVAFTQGSVQQQVNINEIITIINEME